MNKNTLFSALILIVGALLFLLRVTGMTAHIALSVIGLALLIGYTVMTKKYWQKPALEILMRVCYAVALISGGVMMNVHGIAAVAIAHKIGAALFVILFIVLSVQKAQSK